MIEATDTMYPEEVDFLKDKCKGLCVLEIGSYCGRSSEAIASVADTLICVDTWGGDYSFIKDKRSREWYQKLLEEGEEAFNIFKRKMEKFDNILAVRGTSEAVAKEIYDNSLDVIFIDGDHSYEGVKKDMEDYYPKLKQGGIFIMHDCNDSAWPGVRQAVDECITKMEYTAGAKTIGVLRKK